MKCLIYIKKTKPYLYNNPCILKTELKQVEQAMETETETKKETYIDFAFASYALADILYALDNSGIKDFTITKEDGELRMRIPKSQLSKERQHKLKSSYMNAMKTKGE